MLDDEQAFKEQTSQGSSLEFFQNFRTKNLL